MEKITKDEKFAFNKNFKSNNQKVGCYTIPKFNEKATG